MCIFEQFIDFLDILKNILHLYWWLTLSCHWHIWKMYIVKLESIFLIGSFVSIPFKYVGLNIIATSNGTSSNPYRMWLLVISVLHRRQVNGLNLKKLITKLRPTQLDNYSLKLVLPLIYVNYILKHSIC